MNSENEVKVTEELIVKYLSGEANPEEAIALNDWLEAGENRAHFEDIQGIWNGTNPRRKVLTADQAQAWKNISTILKEAKRRQRFIGYRTLAIAASILIAVIAALLYFRKEPADNDMLVVTADSTRDVSLADNSRITMYHNTGIIVPKEFKDNSREVTLVKGEAYFAVAKNDAKPFIIHAGFANIRVLGTEFNVVVKEDEIVVGVDEGKVLFYTSQDSVYIEKGMAISMKPQKKAEAVRVSSNAWAYATKKLVFKDTPMTDVIDMVEKTYGCTIRLSNDNIKNCTVDGTFNNESLENVVFLIAEPLDLKLEKNGEIFILDGKGCH